MSVPPAVAPRAESALVRLAEAGRSPVLVVSEGALGMVVGVVLLTWPGATATVVACLFSVQLLATGVLQMVAAASAATGAGDRVLSFVLGTLSITVGLLCLRAPLQTTLALGLLIGVAWVVGGMVRILQGILAAQGSPRGFRIAAGVLWVIAGGVVLDYPGAGLVALASILGIVLIIEGACLIAVGLTVRRAGGAPSSATADPENLVTRVPPVPPRVRL